MKNSYAVGLVALVVVIGGLSGSLAADEPKVKVKVIEFSSSADDADGVEVIHEHKVKQRVELKLDGDNEVGVYDVDDLEVGETRQFFSESGKEVLLTRTEEGLEVEIDGEMIDLGAHGLHAAHGLGSHKKIFIRKFDGDHLHHDEDFDISVMLDGEGEHSEDHHVVMIDGSEMKWLAEDGGAALEMALDGHTSAADRLIESGVLDELDDDTRERILEVLDDQVEIKVIRKKVIETHPESGDDN